MNYSSLALAFVQSLSYCKRRVFKRQMDLHFRNAGLTHDDVCGIVKELRSAQSGGSQLRSFSVSYNPKIGDDGIKALLGALPLTVQELGMVACNLSDESGHALWQWAQQATGLRMMCVEGNLFSPAMRSKLLALGQRQTGPTVFS